jgi:hypothetical protein
MRVVALEHFLALPYPLTRPLPLPSANPPFTDFTSPVTGSTHEMDFAPWPLDFGLSPRPINLMGRTFKIPRVYAVPVGLDGSTPGPRPGPRPWFTPLVHALVHAPLKTALGASRSIANRSQASRTIPNLRFFSLPSRLSSCSPILSSITQLRLTSRNFA